MHQCGTACQKQAQRKPARKACMLGIAFIDTCRMLQENAINHGGGSVNGCDVDRHNRRTHARNSPNLITRSLFYGIFSHYHVHMPNIDTLDRKILAALQRDCDISLDALGDKVGLSRNACWRRIRALQDAGVLRARVALLDAAKLGLGLTVFIQIRAGSHDPGWLTQFARATATMPEIQGAYRMTGDLDYLIRARVADMADYDRLYQQLIARVPLSDVSASFVMEEIKDTTELPL